MAGLNTIILIGNVGRDPEVKYSADGKAVCNFSLAVSEKYKDKEHTEWFRIVAFGRTAEICGEFLTKGKQVCVEGRMRSNQWEDKDGIKRTNWDVIVNQMVMLGNKGTATNPQNDIEEPF